MSDKHYSVSLSAEAKEDLRSIAAHISLTLKNTIAARNLTQRIRKEVRGLNLFPTRYGLVDWEPWHSSGVHKMSVDNFMVYYIVRDDSSEFIVLRIFYGGRDVESIVTNDDN